MPHAIDHDAAGPRWKLSTAGRRTASRSRYFRRVASKVMTVISTPSGPVIVIVVV
jgi:hypothetical protein